MCQSAKKYLLESLKGLSQVPYFILFIISAKYLQ